MTDEQKQKLASLQTAFLALQDKMREAMTTTERNSAFKAAIIRLMAEPDREVQEALLLWQARRMNIVLDGSKPGVVHRLPLTRPPRSASERVMIWV
jgi:hypothetical protein